MKTARRGTSSPCTAPYSILSPSTVRIMPPGGCGCPDADEDVAPEEVAAERVPRAPDVAGALLDESEPERGASGGAEELVSPPPPPPLGVATSRCSAAVGSAAVCSAAPVKHAKITDMVRAIKACDEYEYTSRASDKLIK